MLQLQGKDLMRLDEGAIVAGAAGRQLESLDGKGEILVVGVVHQEPVVEGLLKRKRMKNFLSPVIKSRQPGHRRCRSKQGQEDKGNQESSIPPLEQSGENKASPCLFS